MRPLILTLGIGEAGRAFLDLSLPLMRAYAARIGADCHVISEPMEDDTLMLNFEKFQIRHFFQRYERILYLDADVLVMPGAPDIFRKIHGKRFAAWNESSFLDQESLMQGIQRELGAVPGWRGTYFNAGIFLAAREHAPLFERIPASLARRIPSASASKNFSDQSYLNWKLASTETDCLSLPISWNWNPICGYIHPAAHLVHFLGSGFFEPERDRLTPAQDPTKKRLRQMQHLIRSFDTGIDPAEPALDLCVTSSNVRPCVSLPRYPLLAGKYEVEMHLHPEHSSSTAPIHCRLFGKKREDLTIARWAWQVGKTQVQRPFLTGKMEYPQFCFNLPTQCARVHCLRIKWSGPLAPLDWLKVHFRKGRARLGHLLVSILRARRSF